MAPPSCDLKRPRPQPDPPSVSGMFRACVPCSNILACFPPFVQLTQCFPHTAALSRYPDLHSGNRRRALNVAMDGWMDGWNHGGMGGRSPSSLTMCQRCYFPHHRTRLDTNNGMHWQLFRETAREGGGSGPQPTSGYANPSAAV